MIHAYNKIYLDDAMHNLGEMFDYAQNSCHIEPEMFWGYVYCKWICRSFCNRYAVCRFGQTRYRDRHGYIQQTGCKRSFPGAVQRRHESPMHRKSRLQI